MKVFQSIVFATLLLMATLMSGQNLSQHQWQDRLVILLASDQGNEVLKSQIIELQKYHEGMVERRIVVYQSLPNQYRKGLNNHEKWIKSVRIYENLKEGKANFQFVLIGLDGGVKLRSNELIEAEVLFSTIDKMFMRRSEVNRKSKP